MNPESHSRPSSAKQPLKLKAAKIAFSVTPYGESKTPPPTPTINSSRKFCSSSTSTKIPINNSTKQEIISASASSISFLSPIPTQKQHQPFIEEPQISNKQQQENDQNEILHFFKNVIKDSLENATKISLQRNHENVKYERAKQEAAVASIAVLEGLVDLLRRRISQQTVKPKRRASSTISLFRGLDEEERNETNSNKNSNNDNLSFLISVADTLESSILGLKAIILPTLANDKNNNTNLSSSSSFFERRFNVALQKNLISDDENSSQISLIESTKQRMKVYHRSLFSPQQQQQQISSILTPEIATRIQNCDRMLELLRKKKRVVVTPSINQNSSIASSSSSITNVWADAEDALHVLRLRFVFHLWKIFSKSERQRRINSFRFTQKLCKERAKVKLLHTFLSFKRSQTQSSVLAAKNVVKENQVLLKKIAESEEKVKKSIRQVEQVNILYRNSLTEIEELRDQVEEKERTPMVLDFRRPIRDTITGNVIEEGILEFRKISSVSSINVMKVLKPINREEKEDGNNNNDHENEKSIPKDFYPYPPFVDWNCPQQNTHARDLLQLETIERLSEKKGIGVPGYQQPSSFYEVRVSQGFTCCVTPKMLSSSSSNYDNHNHNNVKNFLSDCFASNFSTKRWDAEFVAFVNGILKKVTFTNSISNKNNLTKSSNTIKLKNREMVEAFNRARAKRKSLAIFENHHQNNNHGDENNSNNDSSNFEWDINEPFAMQLVHREYFGIIIPSSVASSLLLTKNQSFISSSSGGDVMKNVSSPQNSFKATVVKTARDSNQFKKKIDLANDHGDDDIPELESDSSVEDEEEEEEEEESEIEKGTPQLAIVEEKKKDDEKIFGSFLFSKSNNAKNNNRNTSSLSNNNNFVTIPKKKKRNNNDNIKAPVIIASSFRNKIMLEQPENTITVDKKTSFLNPSSSIQIPPSPFDLLVESIIDNSLTKLKESLTIRSRKQSEETENFVRASTENILEMNRKREEKQEKDRNDLIKKHEIVMGTDDLDDVENGEFNNKKKNSLSTNFCPVAASSLYSWEISTLSDLITNPEITLQLLTIIFGKLAIMEILRKYFRENHDEANELHVFIIQNNNNINNSSSGSMMKRFFSKTVSILVNNLVLISSTNDGSINSLRTIFDDYDDGIDGKNNNSNEDLVSIGRTFCVLLQQHLIFTMSEQEKQCRKIEANSLMLRRLLKASSWRK